MTIMKWRAGYMQLLVYGIIPVPYQLWTRQQLKYYDIYVGFLCAAFCLYGGYPAPFLLLSYLRAYLPYYTTG